MATDDQKIYKFEDTQTGKIIQFEGPADATQDELDWYLNTNYGNDEPQQAAAPSASGSAPVPVSTPQEKPKLTPFETSTGVISENTLAFENNPKAAAAAEGLWRSGERNPEAFNTMLTEQFPELGDFRKLNKEDIAHLRRRDAYYKAQGLENPGNFIATQSTGLQDPTAPEGVVDTATTAVKRSLANMANSVTGLAGVAADVVGADETADSLLEKYVEDQAKIAFNMPRPVESVTDIESLGDAALYGVDILGELAPQITSGMTAGAIGKLAGKKLADKAAAGAIAGTMAHSVGQQTGSIYGDTFAATGEKAPISSIIAGIASGSLESILPIRALNRLGVADDVVKRAFLTRMAQEGSKDFAVEGATEAAQTFIEQLPESVITGESPFTSEMLGRMTEAFVRGGIGGATVGATTAATQKNAPRPELGTGNISVPTYWSTEQTGRPKKNKAYKEELETSRSEVDSYIQSITSTWTNAPQFEVLNDFKSIKGADNDNLGFYDADSGKVFINTEQIMNEAKALKTSPEAVVSALTFHEGLGHYGLAQKFGEELDFVLSNFVNEGDDNFKNTVQTWLDKNPKAYKDDPNRELLAAEEVLAEWSEQGYVPRSYYDMVANKIKEWGRNYLNLDWEYSEREIKAILSMSHSAVLNGKRHDVAGNGFKAMIGYHGSKADFDEFDDAFVGTGEGAQMFGHGAAYIAGTEGRAKHYRDTYSDRELMWNGVKMPLWKMRQEAQKNAPVYLSEEVVDAAFGTKSDVGISDMTGMDVYEYYLKEEGDPDWKELSRSNPDYANQLNRAADYINKNYQEKSSGKLYEVDLPDVAFWLDWEVPIKDTDMQSLLESAGVEVNDYNNWNYIERQYYDVHNKYNQYNDRLKRLEGFIKNGAILNINGEPVSNLPPFSEEDIKSFEAEADLLFQQLQKIAPEYNKWRKEYETNIHENMTGEDVYHKLVTAKGSPKAASEFLSDAGFTGNRYLANNIRQNRSRTGEETDQDFNWVVFKPKDAKIKAKYMRRKSIDPSELTSDELFEAENAVDILKIMADSFDKPVLNYEEIAEEIGARGLSPSDVLRRSHVGPGDIVKKLYMYDIAMEKLNNKLAGLHAKMNNGTWSPKDKDSYLRTIVQFQTLTAKVFGEQSEIGRALNAIKNMQYTKRRVGGIQDALSGLQNAYKDDESFFKFAKSVQEGLENDKTFYDKSKIKDEAISTLSIFRAIMSSGDFSAPFRQGAFLVSRPEFWKSIPSMIKFSMSDESFKSLMKDIEREKIKTSSMTREEISQSESTGYFPTYYDKAAEAGISFSNLDGDLSQREEAFTVGVIGKLPVIAQSNRAYSGYLNKIRFDVFKSIYDKLNTENNPLTHEELKALGDYINNATGRGNLGSLNKSAAELSLVLFSPRLMASRARILAGASSGFATLPPRVRSEARRDLAGFVTASLIVATLAAFNGADIEKDPRSSDFLKPRWGKTRYDILGGFGQYITLAARLGAFTTGSMYEGVTDEEAPWDHYKTIGTGETRKFEGGQFGRSAGGALADFFRNKSSPNASFLMDFLSDQNAIGEEFDLGDAIASRSMPMFVQDTIENAEEYGAAEGVLRASPGFIGHGVQTFVSPSIDPEAEIKFPKKFKRKDLEDMSNEFVQIKDGEVRFKGEARKMAEDNMNYYIQQWMKEEMAKPEWKTMTDKAKAEVISSVRSDARNDAKLDVLEELGLEE